MRFIGLCVNDSFNDDLLSLAGKEVQVFTLKGDFAFYDDRGDAGLPGDG